MKSRLSALLLSAVFAVVALGASGCATRIGPGHVGIKVDLAGSSRGVESLPLRTGWVFYSPFSSQVVEYPTYVQNVVWTKSADEGNPVNEEITFTTRDAMVVAADVNLNYQIDASKVPAFYVKFRSDDLSQFTNGYLRSVARDCFNETAGKYGVEDIMGDNAPFLKDARGCLQAQMSPLGVNVQEFGIIGAPRPPQQVINAINAKVQAQQIAIQKQNEVAQAQADAQKTVAYADGQAKAQVAIANGDAESNRVRAASITPQIIEWRKLEIQQALVNKWQGGGEVVPSVITGGSGNAPLLLNLGQDGK